MNLLIFRVKEQLLDHRDNDSSYRIHTSVQIKHGLANVILKLCNAFVFISWGGLTKSSARLEETLLFRRTCLTV